jgi:hypothetical protein
MFKMPKRMYADVIMNGNTVNLSIRACSEKEARTKLETFPEYRGVSEIIEVSPNPPRNWRDDIEEKEIPYKRRKGGVNVTSGAIHTY